MDTKKKELRDFKIAISPKTRSFLEHVALEAELPSRRGPMVGRGSISRLCTQLAAAIQRGDIIDLTIFQERTEA